MYLRSRNPSRTTHPEGAPHSKTKPRLARRQPRNLAPETPILDSDDAFSTNLADDPAYIHADQHHNHAPGDRCEEDVEHAEAEVTELFRCADRL